MKFSKFILFSLILIISCSKKDNLQTTEPEKFFTEESNEITSDDDFIAFMEIDTEIRNNVLNDTVYHLDSVLSFLQQVSNNNLSDNQVQELILTSGFDNPNNLITLCQTKLDLARKLLIKFPYLENYIKDDNGAMFSDLVNNYYTQSNTLPNTEDECSDNYASGMRGCALTFALEAGITSIGAAAATWVGTPIAGGKAFFGGMSIAMAHYYVCKVGVVDAWRVCRQHHPIN